ncbi:MAG: hypothetical protein V2A62_05025, partial [Candidatus Woesearchaeota archaeon]
MKSSQFCLVTCILVLILLILSSLAVAEVKSFSAQETDLVRVVPQAYDPNNDLIKYYFSFPLDDKGEWQTNYGDAGEYYVNITASDGQTSTVQRILLVIDKKNRVPLISEKKIVVKETQIIDLKSIVIDLDGDALSYFFNAPFDQNGIWKTNYGDARDFITNFWVNDGGSQIRARVEIQVLSTNPGPQIINTFYDEGISLTTIEGEKMEFWANASHFDKKSLTVSWLLDSQVISNDSYGRYSFDYNSSGEHHLQFTVSDGEKSVTKKWWIDVKELKRKPQLKLPTLVVNEGEIVSLNFPAIDQDGHSVVYVYGLPLNESGGWQTNYSDAGEYEIIIGVSNGDEDNYGTLNLRVVNVERGATLTLPEQLSLKEGEELRLQINSVDLDGDKINLAFKDLPEGARFVNKTSTLEWTPSYDLIKRNPTFINNLLNSLHLEKYLLGSKIFSVNVTACDKLACQSKGIKITVENVNRAPYFTKKGDITIKETETVQAQVEAVDSDGDILRYYYTEPLGRRNGKWKTNYGDKGNYTVYVTASDGSLATTVPLKVKVLKNDRAPTLSVRNDDLTVNEGQEFMFTLSAGDLDRDNVTIRLENIPPGASFKDGIFLWAPSFDTVQNKTDSWWNSLIDGNNYLNKKFKNNEKGVVWLNFIASDGEIETSHPVKVTVKNVNRAPVILDYLPGDEITVPVNTPVVFHVTVKDWDKDNLDYSWDFSG